MTNQPSEGRSRNSTGLVRGILIVCGVRRVAPSTRSRFPMGLSSLPQSDMGWMSYRDERSDKLACQIGALTG